MNCPMMGHLNYGESWNDTLTNQRAMSFPNSAALKLEGTPKKKLNNGLLSTRMLYQRCQRMMQNLL